MDGRGRVCGGLHKKIIREIRLAQLFELTGI